MMNHCQTWRKTSGVIVPQNERERKRQVDVIELMFWNRKRKGSSVDCTTGSSEPALFSWLRLSQ